MVVKSDGNGGLIVKKIHAIIALLILIASVTSTVVTLYGINPIKQDVCDIQENEKVQNKEIADLKIVKAVRDVQLETILKEFDKLNAKLEKLNNKLDQIK